MFSTMLGTRMVRKNTFQSQAHKTNEMPEKILWAYRITCKPAKEKLLKANKAFRLIGGGWISTIHITSLLLKIISEKFTRIDPVSQLPLKSTDSFSKWPGLKLDEITTPSSWLIRSLLTQSPLLRILSLVLWRLSAVVLHASSRT